MKILVACESSGHVRDAFLARGHDAWSCDLLPYAGPQQNGADRHIVADVSRLLERTEGHWDMMIAHPPCTYLSVSGLHWNGRVEGRVEKTEQALDFVRLLMDQPIPKIVIENPVSCISSRIRKPDQIIQPYQFGHDASKKTCLWLKGVAPLPIDPDVYVEPRMVDGRPRWANQTDSGQNRLGPSPDRWQKRSETYAGIADAMAKIWG
jgi:site-specific DNA-cytosine methylase